MSPSIVKHPPQHLHEDLRQLSLVTLTTQNKYALMQGAIDASKGSMENAEALLARMEHFDASAAREFGLKEVAVSRAPLRLLRTPTTWDNTIVSLKRTFGASKNGKEMSFLTRSSSTSDTKFKSFIALSYCWHSDDWALAPQCRRVGDMPISPILLRALFDQRKSVDEGVWIDACCIDQANETEKMQAIGSMDVIFKSARLVVIVLEDVFLSSEEADFVRSLPTKLDELICQRAFLPSMHRSLVRILLCRWFTRSWCSHEFQLAHNSLFLVPTESGVVQLNIAALANWWMATDWRTSPVKNWTDIPHRAFPTLYRAGYYRYFTQYRRTPMAQFYSIFDLKATVETDKIGIGANLAGIQLYFTGPEKSVYECRWILAVLALSAGDVAVLCGTGEKLQLSTEESTPSWLRWNENDEDLVASLSAPTLQGLSHIACINPSLIILDLLAIKRCSLHAPSTESIQRATNFIDRTIPQAWTRFKEGGADLSTPEFQEARRKGIEALACSLDCGLVWMMENMIFNPDLVREVQWKMDLHKIDFWPLITELLMEAYPREQSTISNLTKEQKVSLSLFIYYMFRDIIMCHSSSMYNSGLFTVSATLHCYWLDFGTVHGKALTFLNSDNVPECHFALPAVLSGPTCATLARLWLLRPHSTTANDEWRIIEKIPLVTFRPIEADGEAIILRHDQTIRG